MKNRTGKTKLNKSLIVLAVSLALALLIAAVPITYAVFTNSMQAQRTIAAYDTSGDRFSSNYLIKGNENHLNTIYVTDAALPPTTSVTVCNYDQGKQTLPNSGNIAYTLTARLVWYNESLDSDDKYVEVNSAYMNDTVGHPDYSGYRITITKSGDDPVTVTLGGATLSYEFDTSSLAGGEAHSDAYSVSFDTDFSTDQPNLYLEMVVDGPVDLQGIFKTGLRSGSITNSWEGSFNDNTSSAPSAYDGFNYVIEGNGSGTFTLKWNADKLALSYESMKRLLAISPPEGKPATIYTSNSVTFYVDSDEESRYEVQFYKVNKADVAWSARTWQNMNTEMATAGTTLSSTFVGYHFASD